MTDPPRLLDSPQLSAQVARLLREGSSPSAIPEHVERRGRVHAARLAALPTGAIAAGFSLKAAAAVTAALSLTATGAVVTWQQLRYEPPARSTVGDTRNEVLAPVPAASGKPEAASGPLPSPPAPEPAASNPVSNPVEFDEVEPSKVEPSLGRTGSSQPSATKPGVGSAPEAVESSQRSTPRARPSGALESIPVTPSSARSSSDSLQQEAELLEAARRRLASDPESALAMARVHAARFGRGQLATERQLIEVQALAGSGKLAAARSLAVQALAAQPQGLYARRFQQLLRELPEH